MTDADTQAISDAITAMSDADHWVMISVKPVDGGHAFEMHYKSPVAVPGMLQYGQSVMDAWITSSQNDDEGDD